MQSKGKEKFHAVAQVPNKVAAFGAVAKLLVEATYGEWEAEVQGTDVIYHVSIPVWGKLSDQSRKSLGKLIETADVHRNVVDSIYARHTFVLKNVLSVKAEPV